MKMGKLFSSIATATMVLTTLAPAAVANAATGYNPGTKDNTTSLPAATASGENENGGSATATSDASVNVIDGFLVLKSVPNFGFGVASPGSVATLNDFKKVGQGTPRTDGNESGQLVVLDTRHSTGQSTDPMDGMGFDLKVQLGQFKSVSTGTAHNMTNDGNFAIDFNELYETGTSDNPLYIIGNTRAQETATAPGAANDGSVEIVNAAKKKSGGTHTWNFSNKDVNLEVPSKVSKGQYYAIMTWTLSGKAS